LEFVTEIFLQVYMTISKILSAKWHLIMFKYDGIIDIDQRKYLQTVEIT